MIEETVKYIIGLAVAIIGYFLREIHARQKTYEAKVDKNISKFHDEVSILKGKVNALEQSHDTKFDNLEKIIDLKFQQQNQSIDELKSAIRHAERTINNNAQAFVELLAELKKK